MGAILWFLLGPILIVSGVNLSTGIAVHNSSGSAIFNWLRDFDCVGNAIVWLQLFSAAVAVLSLVFALTAHLFKKYICAIFYGCNAVVAGYTALLYFFVAPQI